MVRCAKHIGKHMQGKISNVLEYACKVLIPYQLHGTIVMTGTLVHSPVKLYKRFTFRIQISLLELKETLKITYFSIRIKFQQEKK